MPNRSIAVTEIVVDGRALDVAAAVLHIRRDDPLPDVKGLTGWSVSGRLRAPDRGLTTDTYPIEVATDEGTRHTGNAIVTRIAGTSVEFLGTGPLDPFPPL